MSSDFNFPIHLDMEDGRLPEHKPGYGTRAFALDSLSFLKTPYPQPDAVDEFFERLRRVADEDRP